MPSSRVCGAGWRNLRKATSRSADLVRALAHRPIYPLQVLEIREVNLHAAVARAHRDLHSRLEVVPEEFLELQEAGCAKSPARFRGRHGPRLRRRHLRTTPNRVLD